MKAFRIIFIFFLMMQVLSCIIINESQRDIADGHAPQFSYVNIDDEFSSEQIASIIWAVKYFQEKVPCVVLELSSNPPPDSIKNITISPMIEEDRKSGKEIGFHLFREQKEFILVWPYDEQDKIVKIVLHELAHAFGMPGSHAFPEVLQDRSVLSPVIGNKSLPFLNDKDTEYLNNTICMEK